VPALPSSVLEPLWVRVAALLPPVRSVTRSAATGPASLTGWCSTSSSRCWSSAAAIGASPTTPARRPRFAADGSSGSTPGWPNDSAWRCWPPRTSCSAWSWSSRRWTAGPPSPLRRPDRRAQPDRPPQTRAETLGRGRGGRHPAGRPAGPGQPARRRAAGGHPGRPGGGRAAARPASRAPGRRLRRSALPPGPDRAWHGGPDRHPQAASTDPGGPPLGDRAHPRLGQPVRQAALVHRTAPAGRRVLASVGQRRHHLWPPGPPRLDPLSLGQPPTPSPMTAYWRRLSVILISQVFGVSWPRAQPVAGPSLARPRPAGGCRLGRGSAAGRRRA
jgi:hypothetical protein